MSDRVHIVLRITDHGRPDLDDPHDVDLGHYTVEDGRLLPDEKRRLGCRANDVLVDFGIAGFEYGIDELRAALELVPESLETLTERAVDRVVDRYTTEPEHREMSRFKLRDGVDELLASPDPAHTIGVFAAEIIAALRGDGRLDRFLLAGALLRELTPWIDVVVGGPADGPLYVDGDDRRTVLGMIRPCTFTFPLHDTVDEHSGEDIPRFSLTGVDEHFFEPLPTGSRD